MANPVTNYFALEPLVLDHIRTTVPNLQHVGAVLNIQDVMNSRITPAVYLLLENLQPQEIDNQTRPMYTMEITYRVIIAASNYRDTRYNSDARQAAGNLLATVSDAVMNKQFDPNFTRFIPARTADFHRSDKGYEVYGLAFTATFPSAYQANLTTLP